MSIRISKKVWLIAALGVGLGILLVALTSARSHADEPPADQFSVASPASSEEIEAIGASSKDALSLATEGALPGNSDPQPVSEIGVASMPSGNEMVVVKIGQAMCVMHGADAACHTASNAAAGKLFGARPDGCGSYWVFGLVPDEIQQVQIDEGGDGEIDATLPVVDNVYEGVLDAGPSVAIGVNSEGKPLFETELPLDYYAETNEACS